MTRETIAGKIVSSSSGGAAAPNSKITVHLLDITLPDRGTVILAGQVIMTGPRGRPFPISFKVPYDSRVINTANRYSLSVRIEDLGDDQRLRWISTTHSQILTFGGPIDNVTIPVSAIP